MSASPIDRFASRAARRPLLALVASVAAYTAALAAPASGSLRFDQVFSTNGEPSVLHYRATYFARGAQHRLEVWRDGHRRLVRRTDDAIETHVARDGDGAGYRMVVLDLKRKIETRLTRDDLYRVGNFTDWFDLAHGLRYPQGDYRLTTLPPSRTPKLAMSLSCRWYLLEQGTASTRVCWSVRERLPIAIVDDRDLALWQVVDATRELAPKGVFEVRDPGYVRNDASQDISGD